MADRLNSSIMDALTKKTGKSVQQIRPRLSELRRKHSGLTMNAAAQVYAQSHGTSIMAKLDRSDRESLATVQAITQVSVSSISKVDRRTLNISHSPIHNLSFGDRNSLSQNVVSIDNALAELTKKIDSSKKLAGDEKSDYKSDIQTIASQIGKSKPNRSIVKTAWKGVQALADVEGFAQLIGRITPLIQGFLT